MNRIAARLNRSRLTEPPEQPFRGAPEFWNSFEWDEEERIKQFTQNFIQVGGHVTHSATMEEAAAFITAKAQELEAKYIVRQDEEELTAFDLESRLPDANISVCNTTDQSTSTGAPVDALDTTELDIAESPHEKVQGNESQHAGAHLDPHPETPYSQPQYWKARSAEADIGIVMADHAVAYTGSVAVMSSPHKGRSVSLLPTVLIIVIPVSRLKTRLGEVLLQFDELGAGQLPAGIHFISGPSRSSDIENDLTIGVHGPGIVYAIIVG